MMCPNCGMKHEGPPCQVKPSPATARRFLEAAIEGGRAHLEDAIQMALDAGLQVACTPDLRIQTVEGKPKATLRLVGLHLRERADG